jgi:hypothetical protein
VEALKPKFIEDLFDALAKVKVATVQIEFCTEGGSYLNGHVSKVLDAEGKRIDLESLPNDDGYLGRAILAAIEDRDFWVEYASEAVVGDTDRPRYTDEGTYFQGTDGTVTYNIAERKVSLSATTDVKELRVEEYGQDIDETWDVDKTETAAA